MAETLRVNPIACTGHGVCAELLPVPPALDRDARRAVAACPALALRLARR
jgi:ferredoxin